MNILKKILIGFGILVVLFLLIAAFLPSEVRVERTVLIDAADSTVFDYLTNFEYRTAWDPWLEMEPEAKITLSEVKQGIGAGYGWEGEEIGSGYMEIKDLEKNKSIKSHISFYDPQEGDGTILWNLEPESNKTKLTWIFVGNMDYPVGRFFGLFMDGMLGPSLEKGLSNVDREIKKQLMEMEKEREDAELTTG